MGCGLGILDVDLDYLLKTWIIGWGLESEDVTLIIGCGLGLLDVYLAHWMWTWIIRSGL